MTAVPLVLASSSPQRRALLAQIGITPAVIDPPDLDETPHPGEAPLPYNRRIAAAKALLVAARQPGAVVLAADSVVLCGRRILHKAETEAMVAGYLRLLSGRRHRCVTAVAVVGPDGRLRAKQVPSIVAFRPLSEADIAGALADGLQHAGGYALESRAGGFIRWINGSPSGIIGLPLAETIGLLRAAGYST